MANHAFNVVKGRAIELVNRVKIGDPAAARLYVIPLSTTVAQATAQDVADFAALITAGAVEATTGNWNRKTIAAVDITALSPDNVNDRYDADFVDCFWTAITVSVVSLVVCYASVATPTNAQLVPISHHDFAITADGSDVAATVNVFYRAT